MKSKDLVKKIDDMRELIRHVYINGFESKSEISSKKFDMTSKNLNRLKTWFGEYYKSANKAGRTNHIVIDSRNISHNPLYNAYKMKSFNKATNVEVHFQLIDFLSDEENHSFTEIEDNVLKKIKVEECNGSIRSLLTHYNEIGLIEIIKKDNRTNLYHISKDNISLTDWEDAINFFSESAPVGLIGSFLLDKETIKDSDIFRFKHNYLLHALESHIVYDALDAIHSHNKITIHFTNKDSNKGLTVLPICLYISTQRGYMHLLVYNYSGNRFDFYRISSISFIDINDIELDWQKYESSYSNHKPHMWGIHIGKEHSYDHIELIIHATKDEQHIINRLEREKRNGSVKQISEDTYKYSTDTYDSLELFPWIRTFIGRIESFTCSNKKLEKKFWNEIDNMKRIYSDE